MKRGFFEKLKPILSGQNSTPTDAKDNQSISPTQLNGGLNLLDIFPEKDVQLLWKGDYVHFSPKSETWKDLYFFDNTIRQWIPNKTIPPREYILNRSTIQVKPPVYGDTRGLTWVIVQHLMENYSFPMLYFDVGGYVGSMTIETALLAQYEGFEIEIFTFEPSSIFPVLQKSLEINNLKPKITLVNKAISDIEGPILYTYRIGGIIGGHIGYSSGDGQEISSICDSTTIDNFIKREKGLQSPHSFIIKLDCQGYEYQVYQGCRELLATGYPVIFLSEFLSWSCDEKYQEFLKDFFVLDVTSHTSVQKTSLVKTEEIAAFVERINQTESLTTDLVLIPKTLKNAEQLVSNFLRLGKEFNSQS
jgi:FkbM family methyltransferase